MASCALPPADAGNETDYGSDFDSEDEQLVIATLSQLEADAVKPVVLENDAPRSGLATLPRQSTTCIAIEQRVFCSSSVESPFHANARSLGNAARENSFGFDARRSISVEPDTSDERSPLERFRTAPMKPLSVTDIISPAWCEIQYLYSLTKHGRKRRTPAMKQGSKVHKKLEEQVHTTVEVLVQTREDAWGLKIWNVIQGLRTLRSTGSTRELEVWGVIDGQVINGVIDETSYSSLDEDLEETASVKRSSPSLQDDPSAKCHLVKNQHATEAESGQWPGSLHSQRKVYITDVKTRGSKTLPQGSSLRPTFIQLMLYRKLLADLASNNVNAEVIFKRYNLKCDVNFSDAFIADVGSLDFNFRGDLDKDDSKPFSTQQDAVSELLAHNSLTQLWDLMIQEFSRAVSGPSAIGHLLKAEFRNQQTGDILGTRTFRYDEDILDEYLVDEMSWWRGERKAKGVDIEEAFKCRICEFADICEWRKGKIIETMEKHRAKKGPCTRVAV